MKFTTAELAIIISGISAIISIISVGTSIYFNCKNQKQYNRSMEPALSFKLLEYKSLLYLCIENVGKSAAHEIEISIERIVNNGNKNTLMLDDIFKHSFELYPGEITQGYIAVLGENIEEHVFPKVFINVKYKKQITKKEISFLRTVIFCPAYAKKVCTDVNLNLHEIDKNIAVIARANLRSANYLDGCQVAPFDELNILAHKSLHDDLISIKKHEMESTIKDRGSTIETYNVQRDVKNKYNKTKCDKSKIE